MRRRPRELPPKIGMARAAHKFGDFEDLWRAYPLEGQRDLARSLGGNVPVEENDTAVRLSVALTRVGAFGTKALWGARTIVVVDVDAPRWAGRDWGRGEEWATRFRGERRQATKGVFFARIAEFCPWYPFVVIILWISLTCRPPASHCGPVRGTGDP